MLNLTEIEIRGIKLYQVNDPIYIPKIDIESRLIITQELAPFPVDDYPFNPKPYPVCWSVSHQYRVPGTPWLDDHVAGIWEAEFEYEWFGTTEREIRDFYQID